MTAANNSSYNAVHDKNTLQENDISNQNYLICWDEKKMVMYSNQIVSSQKKQNMEKNLNFQVKCI